MFNILVDYRISEEEKYNLSLYNCNYILCPPCNNLYDAVCGHPDMLLHIIDKNNIILHKDMDTNFAQLLKKLNKNILYTENSLKDKYPYDIILNGLNLNNIFVHNIKYTDINLLNSLKHKKLINVKQGYTKCSTAVLSNNSVITSDMVIAKELYKENIDVLLLPPGDILLPGLNYGFIGGCCGLIEKNLLAFFGDLNFYAYKTEMFNFLKKHKIEPVFLRKGKLIDRGSILNI